jgi:hypothetical protein
MSDDPFSDKYNDRFGPTETIQPHPFTSAENFQFLGQPVTPPPTVYPPFTPAPQRTGRIPRTSRFGVIR